jgi:hypothetical protein
MFSYAGQHGPICMILLEREARLACTFSEGGLTMALVFDPPIACAGNLKQRLNIQCGTTNGPTSPGITTPSSTLLGMVCQVIYPLVLDPGRNSRTRRLSEGETFMRQHRNSRGVPEIVAQRFLCFAEGAISW